MKKIPQTLGNPIFAGVVYLAARCAWRLAEGRGRRGTKRPVAKMQRRCLVMQCAR